MRLSSRPSATSGEAAYSPAPAGGDPRTGQLGSIQTGWSPAFLRPWTSAAELAQASTIYIVSCVHGAEPARLASVERPARPPRPWIELGLTANPFLKPVMGSHRTADDEVSGIAAIFSSRRACCISHGCGNLLRCARVILPWEATTR